MNNETESIGESKPDLPEPYGIIGLFIGFVLALGYFDLVMTLVPNEYFPAHIVILLPIVALFLGVPALFEKIYWRWNDVE